MSAKKDILLTPDPRLSQVCEPVKEINADIRKLAKRMLKDMYESDGCLSFPGISVDIERPSHVIVHATNLDGDLMQYEAEGNLLAVCLQHEIDHLDGVTMVDHLPPLKRAQKLQECEQAIASGARPGETTTN